MFLINALAAKIWTQVRPGLFLIINLKNQKLWLVNVKKIRLSSPFRKRMQIKDQHFEKLFRSGTKESGKHK